MCGGTCCLVAVGRSPPGLSPRVRGNRLRCFPNTHRRGSIPACAGEPAPASQYRDEKGVYPRVCGGTRPLLPATHNSPGLSPRVRGNRTVRARICLCVGSIPACAGEPASAKRRSGICRVYPRVCGGTSSLNAGVPSPTGLSPRVRGNPAALLILAAVNGSIPACAGEPTCGILLSNPSRVYPRVCGGTGVGIRQRRVTGGLSPRVRGNRSFWKVDDAESRSIPACAGEPIVLEGG